MRTFAQALRRLESELAHWDGWTLEGIERAHSWGSRGPKGERPTGPDGEDRGSYEAVLPSWCVTVAQREGWSGERDYHFEWAPSIVEAIEAMTVELVSRRTQPHIWHVSDDEREGYFQVGCADCERDAREIFHGRVEWTA